MGGLRYGTGPNPIPSGPEVWTPAEKYERGTSSREADLVYKLRQGDVRDPNPKDPRNMPDDKLATRKPGSILKLQKSQQKYKSKQSKPKAKDLFKTRQASLPVGGTLYKDIGGGTMHSTDLP